MDQWLKVFLSGCICVLLSACAHTEKQFQKDLKGQVDILGNKAEQAFLEGDIESMLDYYCDDVISMPNNHPMVRGKEDLKRMTQAVISSGLKFEYLQSTTTDVQSDGAYVYEIGTFHQRIIIPGTTESVGSSGKYIIIWRRQSDGSLKIAVEIYNDDAIQHD